MPYSDSERQKQAQKEHYLNNKEAYKNSRQLTRKKRHEHVQSIKEASPCADCKIFYPYYVMQFDHRDSSEKLHNVSYMLNRFSIEQIEKEIAKCDLVCANCHAIRSFNRKSAIQALR